MRSDNKKFSLSLLFSAMVLVLTACGSGGGSTQGEMDNSQKSAEMADQDSGKDMSENADKKMDDNKSESMNSMKEDKGNTGDENKKQDGMEKKQSATDSTGNKKSDSESTSGDTAKKNNENAVDRVLNVTAHDFAFNKEKFVAKSGKITVHFKSVQGTHGFAIYKSEGSSEKLLNIVGKGTKTVELEPGTYYIHCSVVCGGGHGQMDATLIVKG
ncbi:MAG TPA: hypothetical protein VF149_02565 [Bacillales bacterium]